MSIRYLQTRQTPLSMEKVQGPLCEWKDGTGMVQQKALAAGASGEISNTHARESECHSHPNSFEKQPQAPYSPPLLRQAGMNYSIRKQAAVRLLTATSMHIVSPKRTTCQMPT